MKSMEEIRTAQALNSIGRFVKWDGIDYLGQSCLDDGSNCVEIIAINPKDDIVVIRDDNSEKRDKLYRVKTTSLDFNMCFDGHC